MEPTPEEAAALIKSATFTQLVASLLDSLGQDRAGVWALADLLEERGYTRAADALRGQATGSCTWAVVGADSWEEATPGGQLVHLRLSAIGKVFHDTDNSTGINDPSGWTVFPGRKQR